MLARSVRPEHERQNTSDPEGTRMKTLRSVTGWTDPACLDVRAQER
jgi:hypothetical protein